MKIEKLLLAAGETSNLDDIYGVDAHSLERRTMSNWRDYELSGVLKAYESTIKKMIDTGR